MMFDTYFQLNLFLKGSLIFVKNYVYSAFSYKFYIFIMLAKTRQFRQTPPSKSFILEKNLSLWICKRPWPKKIIIWSLLYCNFDARSVQFLSKLGIAFLYRIRIKLFIFIQSNFTVLLTSPEAAVKFVLHKKLL